MSQTLSLKQIELLTASLLRFKAQREARLLAEQRMQAAYGANVEVKPEDTQLIDGVMA